MTTPIERGVEQAAMMLARGERHRHHRNCVHNLTPHQQYESGLGSRRWTYEQWVEIRGGEPVQITPEQWEVEPPEWTNLKDPT